MSIADPTSTTFAKERGKIRKNTHYPGISLISGCAYGADMINHTVTSHRSSDDFPSRSTSPKIAAIAVDPVEVPADTEDMIINRIIDNASSAASVIRRPVTSARTQAQVHMYTGTDRTGAGVFGIGGVYSPSGLRSPMVWPCVSWTSTTPSWPPNTPTPATTSRRWSPSPSTSGTSGADLIRGLATAYEVQIDLVKGICLHEHKIDHVAHLGPSVAAGLGTMLNLDQETIYQAIGQALHLTTATRQSRNGA